MKFSHYNAPGASVYDIEGREKIEKVMTVDVAAGEVVCVASPIRLDWTGKKVESDTLRFKMIYPIYGTAPTPKQFHCYGKIAAV